MLAATLELLSGYPLPWVVENVADSPLPRQADLFGANGLTLCGCMFPELRGLLYEDRVFETSFAIPQPPPCPAPVAADEDGPPAEARRVHAADRALQRRGGGAAADAGAVDGAR